MDYWKMSLHKFCSSRIYLFILFFYLIFPNFLLGKSQEQEKENPQTNLTYRTPRAGEAFETTLFGESIKIDTRDRSRFRALNIGFLATHPKITTPSFFPFLAFFYKKYWSKEKKQIRAILVGLFNQVDYSDGSWNKKGLEFLLSWNNLTPPVPTTEIFDGRDLEKSEVYQGYLRGGLGIGWRKSIGKKIDNELSIGFFYEPAFLYFKKTSKTSNLLRIPPNTDEHGFHFKFRLDKYIRNLLELPHQGFAFGADWKWASRSKWSDHDWRGRSKTSKEYSWITAYGMTTFGLLKMSEKHRLTTSVFGGYSAKNLDRYSALILGGSPSGGESESLSIPILYGGILGEYLTKEYFLATLEYRYEVLFFFYTHFRLTGGWMVYRDLKNNQIFMKRQSIGAFSVAINTGFLLNSLLNLEYSFNWEAQKMGKRGRHSFLVSWSIDL